MINKSNRMKISRNRYFNACFLAIISTVFSLIFGELLLRIVKPQPLYSFEQGLFTNSKDHDYYLTPFVNKIHSQPEYSYVIKANSYGFRGSEPNFNAKYRVLMLGDSFGMGQGVREAKNLCELSQAFLKKKGMDIDIFNTSVSGYSGINQLGVLNRFIKNYYPNLVVLLFYWNDIGQKQSLKVQNGYLALKAGDKLTAPLREWLNNHSHLYSLIKRFYYYNKMKRPINKRIDKSYLTSDLEIAFNYIKKMKVICDTNNAGFLVILLPLEGIYDGNSEFQARKKVLTNQFKLNSILFRDWARVLPKKNREDLVYKIDRHWNEKGHTYFSKFLSSLVTGMLLEEDHETQILLHRNQRTQRFGETYF